MIEEVWKDIPNYEGKYQASNLGRIKTLNFKKTGKEKIMSIQTTGNYNHIILHKNGKKKNYQQRLINMIWKVILLKLGIV